MARILVADDESGILKALSALLKTEGYEAIPVENGEKALVCLQTEQFDLMIADIRMEPIDGMELLEKARKAQPNMGIIMMTGVATVESAVDSMKLGAFDYVTKPFKLDQFLITVKKALEHRHGGAAPAANLRANVQPHLHLGKFVAESPAMRQVVEMIQLVGPANAPVLITGEVGTGKELVAACIHENGPRRDKPFQIVNCGSESAEEIELKLFGQGTGADGKGLLEKLNGGTLLLNDIECLSLSGQSKLLRFLQDKELRRMGSANNISSDVRLLAATTIDLAKAVDQEKFSEAFYTSISLLPVEMPTLREHRKDVLPLAIHFLCSAIEDDGTVPEFTGEAESVLNTYAWPGNAVELKEAIDHVVTRWNSGKIKKDHLPEKIQEAADLVEEAPTLNKSDAFMGRAARAYLRNSQYQHLSVVLKLPTEEAADDIPLPSLAGHFQRLESSAASGQKTGLRAGF